MVSHDRYFLERVCDRAVALLGDGGLRDLPGGVDEYLDLRRAAAALADSSGSRRRRCRPTSSAAPVDATRPRAARKELARLERQLEQLRGRESGAARRDGRRGDRPRAGARAGRAAARGAAERAAMEERGSRWQSAGWTTCPVRP